MPDTITITVPSDAGFVHILRQITGGVAAGLRLTIDDIDDLKLAVDEAASCLLVHLPDSTEITLALDAHHDSLRATISSDGSADAWPTAELLGSLSWKVIDGLAAGASAERADGHPSIVLLKHTLDATQR